MAQEAMILTHHTEKPGMASKEALQLFLDDVDWKDDIVHDDDDDTDVVSTKLQIDGQNYRLILIAAESPPTISVLLISPIRIPKPRAKEAALVLNSLNLRIRFGNLEMDDEGAVYFRWGIDVEGATVAPKKFGNLVTAASSAFDELRSTAVGAAAFTKQSAQYIIREYEKAVVGKFNEELNEAKVH